MNIHAIQTGTVAITTKWREGKGHGRLRLVNTLLDREWTERLPIYAFAIEHPEGVIIVDTGETATRRPARLLPRAGILSRTDFHGDRLTWFPSFI